MYGCLLLYISLYTYRVVGRTGRPYSGCRIGIKTGRSEAAKCQPQAKSPSATSKRNPPDTALGEKIFQKMRGLIEWQIPVFELAPSIVKTIPTRLEDVATMLRVGLTSDTGGLAKNATSGTLLWLSESSEPTSRTPTIPDDLIREIGVSIAFRRRASLAGALQGARIIFDDGTEGSKEIIRQSVLDGLEYLTTELSYDRVHDSTEDVPWLRLLCVRLAVAMAKDGQDQHPVVVRWLEIAKEDPLPEVRNADGIP